MAIEFNHNIFVFTGRLEHFTRDQATTMVKARGGQVENRITHRTRYLVIGYIQDSKSSTKKIYEAGHRPWVTQVYEAEFAAGLMITTPGFIARKTLAPEMFKHEKELPKVSEIRGRGFKLD